MRKKRLVLFCVFLVSMVVLASFVSLVHFTLTVKATDESPFNAIWCYFGEVDTTLLAHLVTGKIFNIYVWFQPFPNYTIHYPYSDAQITTMLNTVRAYDSRFKIYAWIGSYPHDETGQIDLSTPEYRQAMINAVVACAQKGFDGIQDNIEDTVNSSFQDRADYWNNETVALNAISKTNIPITGWGYYWEDLLVMIQGDYVIGGWSTFDENYKSDIDYALKHVISPMIIDISLDASLAEQLVLIDEMIAETGPYSNLAGFSLYIYGAMTSENWTTWNNWTTKDELPSEGGGVITRIYGVPYSIIAKINGVPLENVTKIDGIP